MHMTYLLLNERLSQVWCNRYAIIIVLMMVKVLTFTTLLKSSFSNLKETTLDSCDTIDYYYSLYVGSIPHYMGIMGNFLVEKTMTESVSLAIKSISLLVSVSESVIFFMLELWLGTWVCLIVSAVDGAVDVATNTTESLIDYFNETIISIADELDDGLETLSDVINDLISAVDTIESLFSSSDSSDVESDFDQVNLTISALKNIYLPSSIDEALSNLSASTPDFDSIKNKTKIAISIPFNYVLKEIDAINTTSLVGSSDLLYVPSIDTSEYEICSENEDSIIAIFDALDDIIKTFTIIFVVLSCVAIIISIIYSGWCEWREWKKFKQLQDYFDYQTDIIKNPFSDSSEEEQVYNVDIIETYHLIFHKYKSKFGEWIAKVLTKEKTTQSKIRWIVTYMTSPTATTLLLVGLLGIFICCIQFLIISLLKTSLENSYDTAFSNTVISPNSSLFNEFSSWSTGANSYINETETNINEKLFSWVQETTSSVNDTATDLLDDINSFLLDTFNDTILYDPMSTVVDCVIGNKLETLISAMEWINENAEISFPQVSSTDIWNLIDTKNSSSDSNSTSIASVTTTAYEELTSTLSEGAERILQQYKSYIFKELIIALSIIAVYLALLLIAGFFLILRSSRVRSYINRHCFNSKRI